jgi:hypothetical protein
MQDIAGVTDSLTNPICEKIVPLYVLTALLYLGRLGSSVGIETGYGLDGPGIESRWWRDFPHLSRPALRPSQPPVQGYRVFPGGKERPGRDADPSTPSSAVVMKE